jgi:peptidoglycan/xylan/chitin deacetylase (PgdA/CDA1 family)
VLITFDDGARSIHDLALPILCAKGVAGIAFVIADLIDTETPFWWNEVETLVRSGSQIAEFPRLSPADIVRQLKQVDNEHRLAVLAALRNNATTIP